MDWILTIASITMLIVAAVKIFKLIVDSKNSIVQHRDFMKQNNLSTKYTGFANSGLPAPTGASIEIYPTHDALRIYNRSSEQWYKLDYNKVKSVQSTSSQTPVANNKSSVTRGVVGGIVAGPAGAIIGASSANKQEYSTKVYVHIGYDVESGSDPFVSFSVFPSNYSVADKLVADIKRLSNLTETEIII